MLVSSSQLHNQCSTTDDADGCRRVERQRRRQWRRHHSSVDVSNEWRAAGGRQQQWCWRWLPTAMSTVHCVCGSERLDSRRRLRRQWPSRRLPCRCVSRCGIGSGRHETTSVSVSLSVLVSSLQLHNQCSTTDDDDGCRRVERQRRRQWRRHHSSVDVSNEWRAAGGRQQQWCWRWLPTAMSTVHCVCGSERLDSRRLLRRQWPSRWLPCRCVSRCGIGSGRHSDFRLGVVVGVGVKLATA